MIPSSPASARAWSVLVAAGVAALLIVLDAGPAHACSPGDEAVFDEVVARDADGDEPAHLGVVEQRVVAHAAAVPILTSRRSVWVSSRTWGEVDGAAPDTHRQTGYFAPLLAVASSCPERPAPRTGDVTMTAIVESTSGGDPHRHWMAEEPYRFDPTFEGGLTSAQEEALSARFGPPEHLAAPSRGQQVAWWLWAWAPWLVILSPAMLAVALIWRPMRALRTSSPKRRRTSGRG